MRVFAGGREVEVPEDNNGNVNVAEVRRAANIPSGRMLMRQRPNGENDILPTRGNITVSPYDQFMDAPRATRGTAI